MWRCAMNMHGNFYCLKTLCNFKGTFSRSTICGINNTWHSELSTRLSFENISIFCYCTWETRPICLQYATPACYLIWSFHLPILKSASDSSHIPTGTGYFLDSVAFTLSLQGFPLKQQSPTFLVPQTCFFKDNFFMDDSRTLHSSSLRTVWPGS